jgi:hypothetical protein
MPVLERVESTNWINVISHGAVNDKTAVAKKNQKARIAEMAVDIMLRGD